MHAPNRATIVKGRGKNGLKQAKLQTNRVIATVHAFAAHLPKMLLLVLALV